MTVKQLREELKAFSGKDEVSCVFEKDGQAVDDAIASVVTKKGTDGVFLLTLCYVNRAIRAAAKGNPEENGSLTNPTGEDKISE